MPDEENGWLGTLITAAKWAAIGGLVVTVGVAATPLLGFGAGGVAAGSLAALIQSAIYGAAVPAGSLFALLQSIGATGVLLPAITAGLSAGAACGVSRIVVDMLARAYRASAAHIRKKLADILRGLMVMGALGAMDWRRIVGGNGGAIGA
ncbi:interferon-induced 6-16 family protein [Rhizoctonia solani AG-3 Rhs1AP]|uniref:Interferon-induced 6-16 family protein n=2 Tax=Rhizoctonia solani AG-3 TaxID=1086053 RepID=A0A074STV2_9AGAM|nr:interferon-induced 6-16 family protein [Rhizoctonia solani AG-3 Rhs1AP]KEP53342.1 interferon-induced 6-16 family protein [Rhizoctonia solani 123E]